MARPSLQHLGHLLERELTTTWVLCKNNAYANAGVISSVIIGRYLGHPISLSELASLLPTLALVTFFYAYVFDIANNTTSVEEDRLNKPHRPIPSGLLTEQQARSRWVASWILAPILLFSLAATPWPAFWLTVWEVWVGLSYALPMHEHWFSKSLFSAVGIVIMFRLVNAVVVATLGVDTAWNVDDILPDLAEGTWALVNMHVQDFRDVDGDRKVGRSTLPIVFLSRSSSVDEEEEEEEEVAERRLMWLRRISSFLLLLPAAIDAWWISSSSSSSSRQHGQLSGITCAVGIAYQLASTVTAYRIVACTTQKQDEVTYTVWYLSTGILLAVHLYATHVELDGLWESEFGWFKSLVPEVMRLVLEL